MMSFSQRAIVAALLSLVAGGTLGCELIAGVDRSLIGETSGSIVLQPMTDTLARMAPDNKQPVYSSMIIVVLLRLLSSPA